MTEELAIGFTSLGVLIVIQVVAIAYWGGKLKQSVDDLPCKRRNPGKCICPAQDEVEDGGQGKEVDSGSYKKTRGVHS